VIIGGIICVIDVHGRARCPWATVLASWRKSHGDDEHTPEEQLMSRKVTPADVKELVASLTMVCARGIVHGKSEHDSGEYVSMASVLAHQTRRESVATNTHGAGARVADKDAYAAHARVCAETRADVLANGIERVLSGAPAKRARRRRQRLARAADAPLRLAERLWQMVGIDLSKIERRWLRRRVLVFCGNPTFANKARRGHRYAPAKQLLRELGQRFWVLVVDEYLTSQRCPFCAGWLAETTPGVARYKHCEHDVHHASHNKDALAALSMLRIGLAVLLTGHRPQAWHREHAYTVDVCKTASSFTASSAANAVQGPSRASNGDDE